MTNRFSKEELSASVEQEKHQRMSDVAKRKKAEEEAKAIIVARNETVVGALKELAIEMGWKGRNELAASPNNGIRRSTSNKEVNSQTFVEQENWELVFNEHHNENNVRQRDVLRVEYTPPIGSCVLKGVFRNHFYPGKSDLFAVYLRHYSNEKTPSYMRDNKRYVTSEYTEIITKEYFKGTSDATEDSLISLLSSAAKGYLLSNS